MPKSQRPRWQLQCVLNARTLRLDAGIFAQRSCAAEDADPRRRGAHHRRRNVATAPS
jgi:hypothetical protein